ncbi:MAG: bifunctional DNA-formamidopyrimidine glycosylase/DNA-(apurinic or apyrimidinic site) lyase [Caulobacteraceae bacterium]|nr:bifunctional DNA-formamidopyrimidine glycosylase/DNA-(apurinic or apyrimidinic site) lyase [Caulobacteraceae bacterium]
MPELPEVETVRRGLEPCLAGARLARVEARRPDLRFPLPHKFAARLTGARIERLDRRGKYLVAPLSTGETLIMHLGMTGRFQVEGGEVRRRPGAFVQAAAADARHAHLVFETDAGALITYFDPRRFGFMDLVSGDAQVTYPTFLAMGPEPLGNQFHGPHLLEAFEGRRQAVKTLLLDQTIVAGLGNIYVCEALHRARIAPSAPAGHIALIRLERLASAVRGVLDAAIEAGGSSLRDYADASGAMGYFQHEFRVYGREGEGCPTPGCKGRVRREVHSGRSTFFCATCQR